MGRGLVQSPKAQVALCLWPPNDPYPGVQNLPCRVIVSIINAIQHVKPLDQGLAHTHALELLAAIPLQTGVSLSTPVALGNPEGLQLGLNE